MRVLALLEGVTLGQIAVSVALAAVIASLFRLVGRKMRISAGLKQIPGPAGVPLLGVFPDIIKNFDRMYDYWDDLMVQHGGRTKLPANIFKDGTVMLASPEDVQHVLADNVDNYIKSPGFVEAFKTLFGNSFLCLNHANTPDGGAMWRIQRKVSAKIFTTANFKVFSEQLFYKYAVDVANAIETKDGVCDMSLESTLFTLRTIFDITCGVPVEVVDKQMGLNFMDSMDFAVHSIIGRLTTRPYWSYVHWLLPSERKLRRDVAKIQRIADSILFPRLAESDDAIANRNDILSLFIQKARALEHNEGDSVLDIRTLRDVFVTFIIAGWDSTSSFITHMSYTIAQYPAVQQQIVDELTQVLGPLDATTPLTFDDIKQLKFLDAVAMETIRLFPGLPFNTKIAVNDDHLPDGTFIPAGTEIMYSPWYMGRHNAIWGDDPLVFRPERWLEFTKRPSAYTFPVFQAGPRVCPGMNMALIEAKMFMAVILQRFHIRIQDGEQVANRPYKMATTLAMANGLPLQMTLRSNKAAVEASIAAAAAAAAREM